MTLHIAKRLVWVNSPRPARILYGTEPLHPTGKLTIIDLSGAHHLLVLPPQKQSAITYPPTPTAAAATAWSVASRLRVWGACVFTPTPFNSIASSPKGS